MQAQDTFAVPRRSMDVEDYIDILRRHKSWIVGPIFAGLVASVVGVYLWDDTYLSSTTIKVIPQQVPEDYVKSNVNQQLSERIGAMAQNVLSRAVLTTLIQNLELYPRDRNRLPMDDLVENMRKSVQISNVGTYASSGTTKAVPAFEISYKYTDRFKAQRVVADLASKFIDQSVRERTISSQGTQGLLRDEWERSRKELADLDNKVAAFRSRNQGHLPDEVQSNLQQLNALQSRLSTINGAISRVSQEKLMLETQARIYKEQLASSREPAPQVEQYVAATPRSERLVEAEREVERLDHNLTQLRDHYKDSYKGVQDAVTLLSNAKKKRDQIAKEEEANKRPAAAARAAANPNLQHEQRDLDAAMKRAESQIQAKDLEAEDYRRELMSVNNSLKMYQGRIEGVPMSEKEYAELTRDRDMAKAKFADLDSKMTRSSMADEMEKRKFGESLEILDTASLPKTPVEPKRPMVIGIGTLGGLFAGLLLAGAREVKDSSLKNLKDVRAYTQLPILGSIPLLENDLVVKRRRRIAWLGWSFAALGGVALMAGSVIYYYAKNS